ncbi:dynamin family protein [Exiguobacterium sp. 17-1]|uniref:dynamin family protein n=1 Tax=Exiguobacterium sp. 17-1 TaxID=2931981 RepID=UPI001FFE50CE|nr:dynamin family protein [Exiguobacterium sp. 17-1]MCK2156191.1 dynamin family protein [Exiguobacterium sp. 17-1]
MYHQTNHQMNDLMKEIAREEAFIVVVGEFNHGKTTFVNSLMGEKILPMGILPTTATINIIGKGERKLEVHYKDATSKAIELDELHSFIGDHPVENIEMITVQHPDVPFAAPYYMVDTPGLNDLNKTRSDVSYRFIPKADIVFFLLKADQPISGTELSFLEDTLLEEGLSNIVFVMNFAEEMDDEDELEEMIEDLRTKLKTIKGLESPVIIPYDAYEVLFNGNQHYLHTIETVISDFQAKGSKTLRQNRYRSLLERIDQTFVLEKEECLQLTQLKSNEVLDLQTWLSFNEQQMKEVLVQVNEYVAEQIREIKVMADKSIAFHQEEWRSEVTHTIDQYAGPSNQFAERVEKEINRYLARERKYWLERYLPKVNILIEKVRDHIVLELIKVTENEESIMWKAIDAQSTYSNQSFFKTNRPAKIDPTIMAGVLTGGAATVLVSVGTGMIVPLVGLAVYPILRKKMEDSALKEAKELLSGQVSSSVDRFLLELSGSVSTYIDGTMDGIETNIQTYLANHYAMARKKLDGTIELGKKETHELSLQLQQNEKQTLEKLEQIKISINHMNSKKLEYNHE